MVFNVTFNNISVISWRSVLLVEETGVSWENHRHVTCNSTSVGNQLEKNNWLIRIIRCLSPIWFSIIIRMSCLRKKLTEIVIIIIVITVYHPYSSTKTYLLLKGLSTMLQYDFLTRLRWRYRVIPFGIRSQNHDHLPITPDTAHHSQPPLQIHRHFDLFWKYVTWSLFPLRGIVYSIHLIYRYWSILFFLHEELLLLIIFK
jgi:hypothetical protein